ncbi:MAG: hypothetical protein H7Y01_07545 [Ferruginibacter sp.]|nr:hypothetical protein [Chitinophagaceae bacterium]
MYTYTWKKYLPVIKILLKRSATADQSVSLNRTDFEKTTKLRKPACSFAVEIVRGRLNAINQSVPAKDLLGIMHEDESVKTLLRQHHYAISLNSDFLLSIKDITPPPESEEEEVEEK